MRCSLKSSVIFVACVSLLAAALIVPHNLVAAQTRARLAEAGKRKTTQRPRKPSGVSGKAAAVKPDAGEQASPAAPKVRRARRPERGGKDDYEMERQFLARRTWGGRPIPEKAYERAKEQWKKLPRGRALGRGRREKGGGEALSSMASAVSSLSGTVWVPYGPNGINQGTSVVNGRVSAIAVNPNNPNLIYQGSSGGGLWRTTNGGASWTPLYDQQVSLGIGEQTAVAIDPNNTNTVYVGTSGRFVLNISRGILKSTDGGGTWVVLGSDFPAGNTGNADNLFANRAVNAIVVDPADSNTLYLAASNGLYRSADGGRNWTQGVGGNGDAQSLVLDTTTPANARVLYAGVDGAGVRRSADGGQTWQTILNAATPAVAAAIPPGGGFGKVVVALAPPTNPPNAAGIQVMYVTMEGVGAGTPDPLGVFRSADGGANWNQQAAAGMPGNTQGGYNLTMNVDPASPGDGANDVIYFGVVGQSRSNDSGANFANTANGIHVDTHSDWVFFPQAPPAPTGVFTGNDGGIWRSLTGGATWTGTGLPGSTPTINAGGLQTSLFYNLDVRNDPAASVTIGGLQDNGTVRATGPGAWTDTQGGDGWDVAFDPVNLDNVYNSSGFWSPAPCTRVWRSTDAGASFPTDVTPWGTTSDQGCYLAPVNADPSRADTVYASGSQNVWQTQDGGGSWRIISNTGGAAQLSVARGNSNNVVIGTNAGGSRQVLVSTNALAATVGPPSGVQFTNITRNLPNRFITRVAFDPNDPTVVYATLSGFDAQTPGAPGHVFRTTINGTAWTDISPPVDVAYNAIALDGGPAPSAIYVGNDLGVMRSLDGGASWQVLDDAHFPNVPVTDLALSQQAGVLRAATFGRGVFDFAAPSGPVVTVNAENGLEFSACQGGPQSLTLQVFNNGTQNLLINSVQRIFGSADFSVLPNPSTPVSVAPGEEIDFTVRFTPTTGGPQSALFRVASNDPGAPAYDITATGTGGTPDVDTLIADGGDFGDVCVGAFGDMNLTINNSGTCDLSVGNITSSSPHFVPAGVSSYPLVVRPGGSIAVPVRFQPGSAGAKSGTITIATNDPDTPSKIVNVSGDATQPDVRVTGSTDFGEVCAGALAEKTVSVCNVSSCPLENVTAAFVPATADFTIVNNPFAGPTALSPSACGDIVIRFTPTSAGPKAANLRITSNDPDQPVINLTVTGTTPVPAVSVGTDVSFPATVLQSVGACNSQRPYLVTNNGSCPLTITGINVGGPDAGDYSLLGLPTLPVTLAPGHSLGEGDLRLLFAPLGQSPDRDRQGLLAITYVSDPILHAANPAAGLTTLVPNTAMCGESVRTGARVLVTGPDGAALPSVEKLQLQRITGNRNRPSVDSIDNAMNLPLQSVSPAAPCPGFRYHREYGTVSNPTQLLPGSYQVTATAVVNGKRRTKTVAFDVTACDFNPTVVVQLP